MKETFAGFIIAVTLLSTEDSGGKNANLITNLRRKLGCFDERHVLAINYIHKS